MKKSIKTFAEVNRDEIATAIADFITDLPENEYLLGVSVKLGFDKEGNDIFGLCFDTQVGVKPQPMPYHQQGMC